MGIILDILILLIFFRIIAKNYRRPQLRCGLETGCYILSLGCSVPLATMLSELCYSKMFRGALAHNLEPILSDTAKMESHSTVFSLLMDKMPSVVVNASESYQTTTDANIEEIERIAMSNARDAGVKIVDILAQPVIEGVFRAVFCLIFFCGLLFLFKAAASILENSLASSGAPTQNSVLCGVFGCFNGLVIVTLIVTIIQLVLPAFPPIAFFNSDLLSSSFVFRLFYHQNILMLFLGKDIYPVVL